MTINEDRLKKAIETADSQLIAHALICFEYPEPTIKDSLESALLKIKSLVTYWPENSVKMAIKIRRCRLGDALWFSKW